MLQAPTFRIDGDGLDDIVVEISTDREAARQLEFLVFVVWGSATRAW